MITESHGCDFSWNFSNNNNSIFWRLYNFEEERTEKEKEKEIFAWCYRTCVDCFQLICVILRKKKKIQIVFISHKDIFANKEFKGNSPLKHTKVWTYFLLQLLIQTNKTIILTKQMMTKKNSYYRKFYKKKVSKS